MQFCCLYHTYIVPWGYMLKHIVLTYTIYTKERERRSYIVWAFVLPLGEFSFDVEFWRHINYRCVPRRPISFLFFLYISLFRSASIFCTVSMVLVTPCHAASLAPMVLFKPLGHKTYYPGTQCTRPPYYVKIIVHISNLFCDELKSNE